MKRLKQLRIAQNLSQQNLANELTGISQQSIHKYENDIAEPSIQTLIQLANYFNTSIDYLVGYSDNPHSLSAINESHLSAHELQIIQMFRESSENRQHLICELLKEFSNSKNH